MPCPLIFHLKATSLQNMIYYCFSLEHEFPTFFTPAPPFLKFTDQLQAFDNSIKINSGKSFNVTFGEGWSQASLPTRHAGIWLPFCCNSPILCY